MVRFVFYKIFHTAGMSVLKWFNFICTSLFRLLTKVIAPYPCFMFGKVFIMNIKDIFRQVLIGGKIETVSEYI